MLVKAATPASGARLARMRGFTLLELMVTLAVVAILATIAAPSFTNMIAAKRSKSGATAIYIALTKARSEAIKRNVNVIITPNGGVWQAGWLIADANGNQIDTQPALSGITVTKAPATLTFMNSGRVQGTTVPNFQIAATTSSSAQNCVTTSLSGLPSTKASAC